jgi:hypothetical protein
VFFVGRCGQAGCDQTISALRRIRFESQWTGIWGRGCDFAAAVILRLYRTQGNFPDYGPNRQKCDYFVAILNFSLCGLLQKQAFSALNTQPLVRIRTFVSEIKVRDHEQNLR